MTCHVMMPAKGGRIVIVGSTALGAGFAVVEITLFGIRSEGEQAYLITLDELASGHVDPDRIAARPRFTSPARNQRLQKFDLTHQLIEHLFDTLHPAPDRNKMVVGGCRNLFQSCGRSAGRRLRQSGSGNSSNRTAPMLLHSSSKACATRCIHHTTIRAQDDGK